MEEYRKFADILKSDLDRTVQFWTKYSPDPENGGFFNCLSKTGEVFDTTKFGWLQGRTVWTLCELYAKTERFKTQEILDLAIKGGDFMIKYLKNPKTNKCYLSVTKEGLPLKIQRTIYSEVFYCMGMIGLAKATNNDEYKEEAMSMLKQILHWVRVDDSGLGRPKLAGNASASSLAVPMCILALCQELDEVSGLDEDGLALDRKEVRGWCVEELKKHVQKEGTRVLEVVSPEGKEVEGIEGRRMIPGHALEGGWFLLVEAERQKSPELRDFVIKHFVENPMNYGWDEEHGGLFYFLDVDGCPQTVLEWDMKLWWAHNEAMIALLMTFRETKKQEHWEQFKKVMDYSYKHFVDKESGEWFGYLNRRGEISLDFKGGPWKGCFHVPRALLLCENILNDIMTKNN